MTKGKELVAGASWIYGAQIATVVVQMAYAAITSRLVGADAFAAYGVALAVGALALLLANGGLGQVVGRMDILEPVRVRSLTAYAGLIGLAGAILLSMSAPFWAFVWGAPDALIPLTVMCLSIVVAPMLGLSAGLLRRQGRFRVLSIAIFSCNCVGMLMGVCAVMVWRTAWALLVANIVGQIATLIVCFLLNHNLHFGRVSAKVAAAELGFSWKLMGVSIVSYFNGNIGKWAVSNLLAPGSLGHWNRADVVTTVPFMQVQTAVIQAVYPEFRRDLTNGNRARTVWVDLLTLTAWAAMPAAAFGAVIIPPVASLIFGPGWEIATRLAGPLALVGGFQMVSTLLASAIEALAKFRWIWASQLLLFVVYLAAAICCFIVRDWYPIILGLLLAQIVQHSVHVMLCARAGYLEIRKLVRQYLSVACASVVAAALAWLLVIGASGKPSLLGLFGIAILYFAILFGLWKFRLQLAPMKIILKYWRR